MADVEKVNHRRMLLTDAPWRRSPVIGTPVYGRCGGLIPPKSRRTSARARKVAGVNSYRRANRSAAPSLSPRSSDRVRQDRAELGALGRR
jgi:hypothetical protein